MMSVLVCGEGQCPCIRASMCRYGLYSVYIYSTGALQSENRTVVGMHVCEPRVGSSTRTHYQPVDSKGAFMSHM